MHATALTFACSSVRNRSLYKQELLPFIKKSARLSANFRGQHLFNIIRYFLPTIKTFQMTPLILKSNKLFRRAKEISYMYSWCIFHGHAQSTLFCVLQNCGIRINRYLQGNHAPS